MKKLKLEETPCIGCPEYLECRGTCLTWKRWFRDTWARLREFYYGVPYVKEEYEDYEP